MPRTTTTTTTTGTGTTRTTTEANVPADGFLFSLPAVDALRTNAVILERPEGSNVDIVTDNEGEKDAICRLVGLLPFHTGNHVPSLLGHGDMAAIVLAAHHLNTGDGSIVPQIQGLHERCKVRFSVEAADTEFDGGKALRQVNKLTGRNPTDMQEPMPCAFIGPYRSAVSISTSIILGTLGYAQVSPASVSDELDDKSQYPLFGRTVPSNQGNAIPLALYVRDVLKLQHLAVIYVNDSYGNGYVDSLHKAADVYTPDLKIHPIPLDIGGTSMEYAIAKLKDVRYRFVLAAVFTRETHDALMAEAYKQGVAGNGLHNWFFGATFVDTLSNRVFEKGSPLHLAYRGIGQIQFSGGVDGLPNYDNYLHKISQLQNPTDMEYLRNVFPKYDDEEHESWTSMADDPEFLLTVPNSYNPFSYEAAIALGIAACDAITENNILTGQDHMAALRKTVFKGVSGNNVVFNNVTGTRDPSSALFKVTNYVEREQQDGDIRFEPVTAYLFRRSRWVIVQDYLFNDGTSNIPIDIAPLENSGDGLVDTGVLVGALLAIVIILGLLGLLFRAHRRKAKEFLWLIKREELKFDDPPVILGRGTFGVVMKAQYRGTHVAVKRVVPPQSSHGTPGSMLSTPHSREPVKSHLGFRDFSGPESVTKSVSFSVFGALVEFEAKCADEANKSHFGVTKRKLRRQDSKVYREMKQELVKEMHHLSRLRHPQITTLMGAVLEGNNDPMLVMELLEFGSLYDLLHNQTLVIEGEVILPILRDVSQGMRFLHGADPRVLHGDLKAGNILVDDRFRAKVADFGLSQKNQVGGTGTPYWMAPELLRYESPNTSKSDVFSFGVILYEAYSRKDPYEGENPEAILRSIVDTFARKRVEAPDNMPPPIKLLMDDCMNEYPEQRPTFEEINERLKRFNAELVTPSDCKEQSRSVAEVLPKPLAKAWLEGHKIEAEHKEMVTIFFLEIAGLRALSPEANPSMVVAQLYGEFDSLARKYNLFKIEAIGDAYIAVSNLVHDQSNDHCKRVAQFAVDVEKVSNRILLESDVASKNIVVSMCFHSGPVLADVIGHRNPRYALLGDTINTVSRLVRHSEINGIGCFAGTARLLKTQWPEIGLVDGGNVSIGGKGMMRCFVVKEKQESLDGGNSEFQDASSSERIPEAMAAPLDQEEEYGPND